MPKLLRELEIFEVSSVDKAANKDARVLFFKRDDAKEPVMDIGDVEKLSDEKAALIASIARTWLAKGEDPSVVAGHVKAWINKNNDVGGEGSRPPEDQRDPAEQLEELVDAYVATHKVKRSQAYDRVLHARPDINAALARQRDAKLHKAAQAIGDSYGMR
jgi:hypothetical protein